MLVHIYILHVIKRFKNYKLLILIELFPLKKNINRTFPSQIKKNFKYILDCNLCLCTDVFNDSNAGILVDLFRPKWKWTKVMNL